MGIHCMEKAEYYDSNVQFSRSEGSVMRFVGTEVLVKA
jgi:hypothetical protein